jgi:matrixin
VYPCRSTILAISFLTFAASSGVANAAGRCEAGAIEADGNLPAPRGDIASLRWDRAPELVVMMPVMEYEKGRGTEYRATSQQLTDKEAEALVSDLTEGLSLLTGQAFRGFSAIRRETAAAGETVNVMRPGHIVVARYQGVRDQLSTIGFGGRSTRGSTIRAASIILDSDFDRTNATRRLLRMHELGHALGYDHVLSRKSIMNPTIGHGPTDLDRVAANIAFQAAAGSCS